MTGQFAQMHSDICADQPDLVYFAGRGTDLEYFLESLAHDGACPAPKMNITTGDDANSLVGSPLPADAANPGLLYTVFYLGLAHADEWQDAATHPDPSGMTTEEAANYQQFADAFTLDGFAEADLADGMAIMVHDAVFTAATAIRDDRLAVGARSTVAATMLHLRCAKTIPGAGGFIAIDDSTHNPRGKTTLILQANPDGSVTQKALEWPGGKQINYFRDTC